MRALIVDDDARNLDLLERLLAPIADLHVERAPGGREALAAFEREPPDLVLLDVMMPELDGFDVLTHIRARATPSRVPVVLVTAAAEHDNRVRGLELGADDFLEKPVDAPVLLARVKTLLRLKAVDDALIARNTELERLRKAQEQLVAFMVHDLKNPLASIVTNVEYLRLTAAGELADVLDDVASASHRLGGLIADMLAVSRLEEAGIPLGKKRVDVSALARSVLAAHKGAARVYKVELAEAVEHGLAVDADEPLLERTLCNLIENAVRHTTGDRRVRLSARREGATVELSVSNTGTPVPPDSREIIFEKFAQGPHTEARARGSVGLGLYFCQLVAAAHGGSIEVAESSEWPVSFVLRLPAC